MLCSIRAMVLSIGRATGVTIRYRSAPDAFAKASSPRLCMENIRDLGATGWAQDSKLLYILELAYVLRLLQNLASVFTLLFSPNAGLGKIRAVFSPFKKKLTQES